MRISLAFCGLEQSLPAFRAETVVDGSPRASSFCFFCPVPLILLVVQVFLLSSFRCDA